MVMNVLATIDTNLKKSSLEKSINLEFLEDLIKNNHYLKPKNSSQIEFMKLIQGSWIFTFRNEIIQAFTHEDIGRYPTDIDGMNSRTIYAQRIHELDKLMEKIEGACKKINEMLNDAKE